MSRALRDGALPGAIAGLIGGLAFGASMIELGALESIASLVRADTPVVGFVVHMVVAAMVGAVFGLLVFRQRATAADTLVWGVAYGAFFWFVGPLTLRPLILGQSVSWEIATAHDFFASLIGHVVWGAVTGVSLASLRGVGPWRHRGAEPRSSGAIARWLRLRAKLAAAGGVAGAVAAAILIGLLPARDELTAPIAGTPSTNWPAALAVGVVAGALYAALVPSTTSPDGPRLGPRLVLGIAFGYLTWIVVALTIVPLQQINTLAWSATLARSRFEVFPGYVLLGVLIAFLFYCLAGVARFLFSDEPRHYDRLTAGPQRLRAVGRGAGAGIFGGLLFTIIMVQIGALGQVSRLVGAESPVIGFFVHMGIAVVVGATYALLFRRQSFDVRSGVGWGVAYGLLWWILGSLTLFPVLLGGTPQWSAEAAGRAFPALVGHLVYGIGLGVVFYLLEARHSPWWITRSEAETERTRARREQVLTSAPALWAFVVFVAIFVAIVLS